MLSLNQLQDIYEYATVINVQWENVQGVVLRGYPDYKFGVKLLLKFKSGDSDEIIQKRKAWIKSLSEEIAYASSAKTSSLVDDSQTAEVDSANTTTTTNQPKDTVQFVAFTISGLSALEQDEEFLHSFSNEFREGMYSSRCAHTLGDNPQEWDWGGSEGDIDLLLIIYAKHKGDLQEQIKKYNDTELFDVKQELLASYKDREHFGFRDGLSQPIIDGTHRSVSKDVPKRDVVKPGEFILGYVNEHGGLALSPNVKSSSDPHGFLPMADAQSISLNSKTAQKNYSRRDFGKNGTYLVLRQLEQNVEAFDAAVLDIAKNIDKNNPGDFEEWVAAKLMGRWKNGRPLTLFPKIDGDELPQVKDADTQNDFSYAKNDTFGYGCPIGSHVRRSNPRDTIAEDPEKSENMVKRHRILRRGRLYGIEPECKECGYKPDNNYETKGMMFMCLNTKIERQFEFIQQSWLNQSKFQGLIDEVDPISAHTKDKKKKPITIQASPIRIRTNPIDKFVTVKGGAYFFLPGRQALEFLAYNAG